jgi:hypothetical protein
MHGLLIDCVVKSHFENFEKIMSKKGWKEIKRKGFKKRSQTLTSLYRAQQPIPPPFSFSFPARGPIFSRGPLHPARPNILHPSRPAYLPLSHSLTNGQDPPVRVAFNLQTATHLPPMAAPAALPGALSSPHATSPSLQCAEHPTDAAPSRPRPFLSIDGRFWYT